MGYTITIGNAILDYCPEWQHIDIDAEYAESTDAPDHCPFTKQGNSRSPSYIAWHEFCKEAGLENLFYGDKGQCPEGFHRERALLANHPGAAALCQSDLDLIRSCRERRESSNDGRPPGFWDYDRKTLDEIDNGKDPTLARLLWLEFWVEWALKNCPIPICRNT